MARLKADIEKIEKREKVFDDYSKKRQEDTSKSIENYKFMQKIFGTNNTEKISYDFCSRDIIK